jgi:zinc transporter ZupT
MLNFLFLVFAVLIGYVFVLIFKPSEQKNLKLLLAFSGSFLLSITVFNLLPEVYSYDNKNIGLFIIIGILFQIILEFFSKGAEHGHVHLSKNESTFPWLLFISLSIHSVLEGLPITSHDSIIYGIVIHKLPVAIILSTFFLASKLSNVKIIIFLTLFSLMTPLGILFSEISDVYKIYYPQIMALVIGIFLHISTIILFESSEGHKFNLAKLLVIVTAIIIAYLM